MQRGLCVLCVHDNKITNADLEEISKNYLLDVNLAEQQLHSSMQSHHSQTSNAFIQNNKMEEQQHNSVVSVQNSKNSLHVEETSALSQASSEISYANNFAPDRESSITMLVTDDELMQFTQRAS